jgi:hypothetical protein
MLVLVYKLLQLKVKLHRSNFSDTNSTLSLAMGNLVSTPIVVSSAAPFLTEWIPLCERGLR